jgi:hypothetical protein
VSASTRSPVKADLVDTSIVGVDESTDGGDELLHHSEHDAARRLDGVMLPPIWPTK